MGAALRSAAGGAVAVVEWQSARRPSVEQDWCCAAALWSVCQVEFVIINHFIIMTNTHVNGPWWRLQFVMLHE